MSDAARPADPRSPSVAALAGVIGHPIGHSRSPRLHRHWIARHGIDAGYVAIDAAPDEFDRLVRVLPAAGFRGLSVTLPHKVAALAMADVASERARIAGAANLLVFRDGRIEADATDGAGFVAHLRQSVPEWDPAQCTVGVLGAGGAARGVVAALLEAGVPALGLTNRSAGRAEALVADLPPDMAERIALTDWVEAGNLVEVADLVINTTSLGMDGQPLLRVPLDGLRPGQIVADLVYAPLETPLLSAARAAGATAVDGLGMLLHQAVPHFEAWFGVRPEVDEALRAAVLA